MGGIKSSYSVHWIHKSLISNTCKFTFVFIAERSKQCNSESAVAYGAVLRAWNKEDGPDRKIQSSYGFEITSPYDDEYPPHIGAKTVFEKLDGIYYVPNIIEWRIRKARMNSR
jgi:hypothetical protein